MAAEERDFAEREDEPTGESGDARFAVLEVFGLKLEVSNPRLAELLTMDAGEALQTDVRDLVATPAEEKAAAMAEIAEALPDVVVTQATPHDEADAQRRREFRAEAESLGQTLGFEVGSDGVWKSPSGVAVVARTVDRAQSLAAATHFVQEVAGHREQIAGRDSTALFVVDSQQTADVFKVAIRQRRLYDLMRTISIENLRAIAQYAASGVLDHGKALVLLAPLENIDVGEVLSVIRSAQSDR